MTVHGSAITEPAREQALTVPWTKASPAYLSGIMKHQRKSSRFPIELRCYVGILEICRSESPRGIARLEGSVATNLAARRS